MKTELKFTKEFWAIVKCGDVRGYHTGKPDIRTVLIEFDTATELTDALGHGSVESGESMGEYIFHCLCKSHSQDVLRQIEEYEQSEKMEEN